MTAKGRPGPVALRDAFASADRKRAFNRWVFTTIASRYDLITRVLSYGQDQRWKRALVELGAVEPGAIALDVACGTGDLTLPLCDKGAVVAALDLTPAMLARARSKVRGRAIGFVAGDMHALPFADARFDVITAGYALRNLPDLDHGLRELARVAKSGGRLLVLDFDRPGPRVVREVYLAYLWLVGSLLGLVLHGDPDTYRYIAASLRRYPGAREVGDRLRAVGFTSVVRHPVLGGLLALHVARRE